MSVPRSFVCHKPVSDGVFVEGPVVCNEIATSELEQYWANTTQRASAERTAQHIGNINKKLGRPEGSGANPEDIHSTFKQLDAHIRDTNEPRDAGLFGIGFPWKINFYEDINQHGDSFDLGVVQQTNPIVIPFPFLSTFDWDRDLTQRGGPGGSWNDQISCVECQGPDKYWVLFQDINFGGARMFGNGNVDNLVPNGWNDMTSSIIMCSIPGVIITDAIIAILTG